MREWAKANVSILTAVASVVSLALVFGAVGGVIPSRILPRASDAVLAAIPHLNAAISATAIGTILLGWRAIARGNVFIERNPRRRRAAGADTTRRTFLFGERARNEETSNRSRVRGRALLVQIRSDSLGQPTDTLVVAAQEMDLTRRDRTARAPAAQRRVGGLA